jgi:integrase/recombinase XerC
MRAANERDTEALWRIVEAYIITKGRKKAGTSPATLLAYRVGLERLLLQWSGENLLRPSRNAADNYIVELQEGGTLLPSKREGKEARPAKPLNAGTIQVRLAAARAFYRALRWTGATEGNPFLDVFAPPNKTPPEDRRVAYEEEEVEKLYFVANELDAVIIALGADAGLRAQEMLDLRWSDVKFSRGALEVESGKGAKFRVVRLTNDTLDVLKTWKKSSSNEEHVLPFRTTTAARLRLQKLCSLAGVDYKGLHALRHYCGTWTYHASDDLNVTRKHLGHSDISTTTIYAKMDDRKLKAALARRRSLLSTGEQR